MAEYVWDPTDAELPMKISILENEITKGNYELINKIFVKIPNSEKTAHSHDWRTYREKNSHLEKHVGQSCLLILGQFTQQLQYKMSQDTYWYVTITSYNPLNLIQLIEKTTLVQTEYQYLFATVYDQELAFYMLHH